MGKLWLFRLSYLADFLKLNEDYFKYMYNVTYITYIKYNISYICFSVSLYGFYSCCSGYNIIYT